ncbi:hypothetical protein [Duganella callida]|uniref:Uncharacterized protein n=1 Tax=Duganella callida TaxID=2561932 RepID=A0A4Y9S599_9BURK|nr:hypothetical protein [Duganella callida]TFW15653.1 hypothetical protein E4L98_25800 [Duganella callida]
MKTTLIVLLCAVHGLSLAGPQQQPVAPDLGAPEKPGLTDEVIRKAVRDTIAEDPRPLPADKQQGPAYRSGDSTSARMSAAFDEAKVPDCLHGDALRLQPATIGPIAVVGPYALPWLIAAAVRGKCR